MNCEVLQTADLFSFRENLLGVVLSDPPDAGRIRVG
jgi:hypothetical protein